MDYAHIRILIVASMILCVLSTVLLAAFRVVRDKVEPQPAIAYVFAFNAFTFSVGAMSLLVIKIAQRVDEYFDEKIRSSKCLNQPFGDKP